MKIIADTHTHSIASTHAYSTILENAQFAKEAGMVYLAMTDHAPSLTDAPHLWHFHNMRVLPDELFGVKILKGCEVNILNKNGDIDIDFTQEQSNILNWIVASFHYPTCKPMSIDDTTSAYLNLAKNPHIDVIGHSGTASYEYDYETAIKAFRDNNKLVEINEASFNIRQEGVCNCLKIAKLCKQYRTKVILDSDAHFAMQIGHFDKAIKMLEEIDFPEELIVNSSVLRFENYLKERNR